MSKITIFTDGSSLGNPGPGGYGVVVLFHDTKQVVELGGHEEKTTNNRMELTAAISALSHLSGTGTTIALHTDSSYVINGITKWVHGWERNNWMTAAKGQVLNQDLWKKLLAETKRIEEKNKLAWHYVQGHAGIPGNERTDTIATSHAEGQDVSLFAGTFQEYELFLSVSIEELDKQKWAPTKRKGKAFSYISEVGGVVESHKDWKSCEARVRGKKARFRKVGSKEEEDALLKEWAS